MAPALLIATSNRQFDAAPLMGKASCPITNSTNGEWQCRGFWVACCSPCRVVHHFLLDHLKWRLASRHFSPLDFWFPALSRKFTIRPFSWTEFCPVAVVSHGCLRSFCPFYLLTLFVATTTLLCFKFAFICCLPTRNHDSRFVICNLLSLACFVFLCWVLTGLHHDRQPLTIFWMSFLFVNDDFHCFLQF